MVEVRRRTYSFQEATHLCQWVPIRREECRKVKATFTGGMSSGISSGGKSSKFESVSTSGGGSVGSGGSSWSGVRRLGTSWTAPVEALESPDIVWVGSSEVLLQRRSGKGEKTAKSSKSRIEKHMRSDVRIGFWPSSNGDSKFNRYAVLSWSSPMQSPAPTICTLTTSGSSAPSSSPPMPTKYPTEAPTTCNDRFSSWYFNMGTGECVTGYNNSGLLGGGEHYNSLNKCCEEKYPEKIEYCKEYLYEDGCCSMNHHVWYFNPIFGVCTNDMSSNLVDFDDHTVYYDGCCSGEFNQFPCPARNICIPEVPEYQETNNLSVQPTGSNLITVSQTIIDVTTTPSTAERTTLEPTFYPSAAPSTEATST